MHLAMWRGCWLREVVSVGRCRQTCNHMRAECRPGVRLEEVGVNQVGEQYSVGSIAVKAEK